MRNEIKRRTRCLMQGTVAAAVQDQGRSKPCRPARSRRSRGGSWRTGSGRVRPPRARAVRARRASAFTQPTRSFTSLGTSFASGGMYTMPPVPRIADDVLAVAVRSEPRLPVITSPCVVAGQRRARSSRPPHPAEPLDVLQRRREVADTSASSRSRPREVPSPSRSPGPGPGELIALDLRGEVGGEQPRRPPQRDTSTDRSWRTGGGSDADRAGAVDPLAESRLTACLSPRSSSLPVQLVQHPQRGGNMAAEKQPRPEVKIEPRYIRTGAVPPRCGCAAGEHGKPNPLTRKNRKNGSCPRMEHRGYQEGWSC